jgi:hypothetical protein
MGFVAPTPAEVTQFYLPKIATKTVQLRTDRAASAAQINSIPGGTVDVEKLTQAVDRNPSISDVRFGDSGTSPPPSGNFERAFAFFETPSDKTPNAKPRLVLVDAKDKRWRDNDRYEFLASAVFEVPEDNKDFSKGVLLSLYPGDLSDRVFLNYYDAKTKRIYSFEGDAEQISSIIPVVLSSKHGEQEIGTRIN